MEKSTTSVPNKMRKGAKTNTSKEVSHHILLALEEYYWRQRSRSEWLHGGDRKPKALFRKLV